MSVPQPEQNRVPAVPPKLDMSSAAWIRGGDRRANTTHCFRAVFEGDPGQNAVLRISAVNRYRVWLNGTLLGEGPPPSIQPHERMTPL
jgi:hypothetical protein